MKWIVFERGNKWWVTTGIMVCLGDELWCIKCFRSRLVSGLVFSPSYPRFFHRFIHRIFSLPFVTNHPVVSDKTLPFFFAPFIENPKMPPKQAFNASQTA